MVLTKNYQVSLLHGPILGYGFKVYDSL